MCSEWVFFSSPNDSDFRMVELKLRRKQSDKNYKELKGARVYMLLLWCNERIQGTEEFQWVYNSRPGMPPLFVELVVLGTSRKSSKQSKTKKKIKIQNEGNGIKKLTAHSVTKKRIQRKEKDRGGREG